MIISPPPGPEAKRAPHAITRRDDGLWFEWTAGAGERRAPVSRAPPGLPLCHVR